MSQLNVNTIKNRTGQGGISLPLGANSAGVITATNFDGLFDWLGFFLLLFTAPIFHYCFLLPFFTAVFLMLLLFDC